MTHPADQRRSELVEIVARAIWIAAARMDSGAKRFMPEWEKVDNRTRATWLYYATDALDALTAAGVDLEGVATPLRYRHKKRGTEYSIVAGYACLQTSEPAPDNSSLVLYKNDEGQYWARPTQEFMDGRFELLPTPPKDKP